MVLLCSCWETGRRQVADDDVCSRRGGKEMADEGLLADFAHGKTVADSLTVYLVVRFPGASFALPSEEDSQDELPVTAGEESVMRSSRIVLRGTVTIPVPERDMQRVVHRILNRGSGSDTPSLEDLVSSMSYLPRYRRLEHEGESPHRRAPAAGPLSHRRRRRRRMSRSSSLAVDLRAHSVSHGPGPGSSMSAYALCSSAAGDMSLQSWSRYLDLELQQPHFSQGYDDGAEAAESGAHEDGRHDGIFDQDLGLDASHESMQSDASFRRITELEDVDEVYEGGGDASSRAAAVPSRYSPVSSYSSYSYQRYDRLDPYYEGVSEEGELARSQSTWRATNVPQGLSICVCVRVCGRRGVRKRGAHVAHNAFVLMCHLWRAVGQQQLRGQLPRGRMAGKRKHAEMSGQALLEQRLTARCRNLSLEDEEDAEKDVRAHVSDGGGESLDAQAASVLGGAQVGDDTSGAMPAGRVGVLQLSSSIAVSASSSIAVSALHSASSDQIACWEWRQGNEEAETRHANQEPATPLLFASHHVLAEPPSARSTPGQAVGRVAGPNGSAASCNDARARADEQLHQFAPDMDGAALTSAASSRSEGQNAVQEASSAKPGSESVQAGSSMTWQHVPRADRRQDDEREAARVLQHKEGGIHMSSDPLASVPLEELGMSSAAMSYASMRPVSATQRSSFTRNGSAPHTDSADGKSKERRADVPAGSEAPMHLPCPMHLPWSGVASSSSSVMPTSVPSSAPAGPRMSNGTALEVFSCVSLVLLSLGCWHLCAATCAATCAVACAAACPYCVRLVVCSWPFCDERMAWRSTGEHIACRNTGMPACGAQTKTCLLTWVCVKHVAADM